MNEIIESQKQFLAQIYAANRLLKKNEKQMLQDKTVVSLNKDIKKLSEEMRKNYTILNEYKRDKNPIIRSLTENLINRKDNLFQKFTTTNIIRKLFGIQDGSGTLADAIVSGMERKRLIRDEKKQFRQDYAKYNKQGFEDSQNLSLSEFNKKADALYESIREKQAELAKANIEVLKGQESIFGRARDIDLDTQARLEHELALLTASGHGDAPSEIDETKYNKPNDIKIIPPERHDAAIKKEKDLETAHETEKETHHQTEILEKIEENTRGGKEHHSKSDLDFKKLAGLGIGGEFLKGLGGFFSLGKKLLSGIFGTVLSLGGGLLKKGLMWGLTKLLNPMAIFRVVSKIFLPAMIIGSIIKGIYDGFKEWKKTGSIREAIIAGLGGILQFLTFGLFDKEDFKKALTIYHDTVDKYLVTPLKDVAHWIADKFSEYIAKPIKEAFDKLIEWKDNFVKWISDTIDKLNPFTADNVEKADAEKKIPKFGKVGSPTIPENVVKSKTNEAKSATDKEKTTAGNTTVVNAPSTVNKSVTNNYGKSSTKNTESSINKYFEKRFSFT